MGPALTIVEKTTNVFVIDLVDASGERYVLQDAEFIAFGISSDRLGEGNKKIFTTTTLTDEGYYLEMNWIDLFNLEPGQYYYEVSLAKPNATKFYNIIPASPFTILPGIVSASVG